MPLDDGAFEDLDRTAGAAPVPGRLRARSRLPVAPHVGQALKDLRVGLNLSLRDVSRATKVGVAHLEALEAFDLSRLPARPFALGYLRAYAEALGVEPGEAVARFKAEAPKADTTLHAPAGIAGETTRRLGGLAVAAAATMLALAGWNIARHAAASTARPEAPRATAERLAQPAIGPASLGAPLPAPPEASTPPVYQTPGLAAAAADGGSADAAIAAAAKAKAADAALQGAGFVSGPAGARFVPAGPVLGAPAPGAGLVLQAQAPTILVVRGPAGQVYFAREMAPGQAWRAPSVDGLTVEAGDPQSVEAFVGGVSRGLLTHPETPLAKLLG